MAATKELREREGGGRAEEAQGKKMTDGSLRGWMPKMMKRKVE